MKAYTYRLSSTGGNSSKYGNCEICNKPASEFFQQVEGMVYLNPVTNTEGTTHSNCHNIFGHKECLISKQNSDYPLRDFKLC